jgi:hypothetical protein
VKKKKLFSPQTGVMGRWGSRKKIQAPPELIEVNMRRKAKSPTSPPL